MSSVPESLQGLPVVLIGAGPAGLAAAAHLADRGIEFVVFEAGESAGAFVSDWAHVRLFSPWSELVDPVAAGMLKEEGWEMPDASGIPTGAELVAEYLTPLAQLRRLAPSIRYGTRVTFLTRRGHDKVKTGTRSDEPFVVTVETAAGVQRHLASAVIDASGTWAHHNPLGADGTPAIGEVESADRISYGLPDVLGSGRNRFAGNRVLVVGAGHSAANVILDLLALQSTEPGTEVVWAVRRDDVASAFGGGDDDQLEARGALGNRLRGAAERGAVELVTGFAVEAVGDVDGRLEVTGLDGRRLVVDQVIASTGQRPDLTMTRELRLDLDPWLESPRRLAPLIDPNEHSCGTVPPHGADVLSHPEDRFYTVGIKSYGRAPTFLTLTGYEQVRSVVASLAGDTASAARIELLLPETGVCSGGADQSSCS
ncbi:MAG: NAD(P)-binding domain-containing protein [Acidimicrobiia bacterium]